MAMRAVGEESLFTVNLLESIRSAEAAYTVCEERSTDETTPLACSLQGTLDCPKTDRRSSTSALIVLFSLAQNYFVPLHPPWRMVFGLPETAEVGLKRQMSDFPPEDRHLATFYYCLPPHSFL